MDHGCALATRPLNKFEVSRLVGMRALQLAHGETPSVVVSEPNLRDDPLYVASLELYEGKLDALVKREDELLVDPRKVGCCESLALILDLKDGGTRRSRNEHALERLRDASARRTPS